MEHQITPLLFIGFFSPSTCRVSAVSANKISNEHLISLRDYDFVGEDPRLKAALADRMQVLQGEVDLTDLDRSRWAQRSPPDLRPHLPLQLKPDYLNSTLNFPQMVNVSLDYAEIFNASELIPETNASWDPPALAPEMHGAPVPDKRGALVPDKRRAPAPDQRTVGPEPAPSLGPTANPVRGPGGRRQYYVDFSKKDYNLKILGLMKQIIYGAQRKILELDHIIKKYEPDPRFRMAYIFNRLDEWLHNLRTVYFSTQLDRYQPRRVKRVIWYYEHSLRINIDITYSIEHLVFLHNEYMKNMEALVPMSKRKEMRAAKLKQLKDEEERKAREREKERLEKKNNEEEIEKESGGWFG